MDFISDGFPSGDLIFTPNSWCIRETTASCGYEGSFGDEQGSGHCRPLTVVLLHQWCRYSVVCCAETSKWSHTDTMLDLHVAYLERLKKTWLRSHGWMVWLESQSQRWIEDKVWVFLFRRKLSICSLRPKPLAFWESLWVIWHIHSRYRDSSWKGRKILPIKVRSRRYSILGDSYGHPANHHATCGAMGTKIQDIAITNRPGRNSFPGSFYFYE